VEGKEGFLTLNSAGRIEKHSLPTLIYVVVYAMLSVPYTGFSHIDSSAHEGQELSCPQTGSRRDTG
jgi:hypothetical protein